MAVIYLLLPVKCYLVLIVNLFLVVAELIFLLLAFVEAELVLWHMIFRAVVWGTSHAQSPFIHIG